ncbi:RNA recognition motif 2 [Corchorus capsularis]|uniref:RNA recognition motif 2 n=1 Tax=Corchorus capsularis TaxID=210143 RepID=A0A1R3HRA5_COCAP|nr:RNA recognition motif 2 [Corchorus capsularis]
MLPSSSHLESSSKSKPALNPCAVSFEPSKSGVQVPNEICLLPHQQFPQHETYHYQDPFLYAHHPQASMVVWHPIPSPAHHDHQIHGFQYCTPPPSYWNNYDQYLTQYDPHAHPHSHLQPNYGLNLDNSLVNVGIRKKQPKKAKYGFLPPRLRLLRENPVPGRIEIWVPKKVVHHKIKASFDGEEQAGLDGKTSLMIRNIPNHWRRLDLQHKVDAHCRKQNGRGRKGSGSPRSEYDFLYVPMDFGFGRNLGYAFVNFTTDEAASRFSKAFSGMKWASGDKTKYCEVTSADHQGRKALEQKHERSTFGCHTDEYLPVVYSPPRDGFNKSKPITVGRCTYVSVHSNEMIMTRRKEMRKKAA